MAANLRYRDIYISNEDAIGYPGHNPGDDYDGMATFVCNVEPTVMNPVAISMISATIPQMQTTIDIVTKGHIIIYLSNNMGMPYDETWIPKGTYKDINALRDVINEGFTTGLYCFVDALQERLFFTNASPFPHIGKITYNGDLGRVLGFPTNTPTGGEYLVVTPDITLNGIFYDFAMIAPYTYDHYGGMHNIYIELTTPEVSFDSLAVSSDQFLKSRAIIKKLNVNYSQDVLNYNASSREDEIILGLPESTVPLQSIGLTIWAYSGTVYKWFQMTYPGARLEFTLRLYYV